MINSSGTGKFNSVSLYLRCREILIPWNLYKKWEYRVVVQGQGPGPRYGHVMDLVAQRYLVSVSGNDGKCK